MEFAAHTYHSMSQILSLSTFRKILFDNDSEFYARHVSKNAPVLKLHHDSTNLDVIRKIYSCLSSNYRNEYLYKNLLFEKLVKEKKLKSTVVLNELRISKSIADTVFVNGEAVLYEIKTELDNSDKLETQIADYQKAFNKIYVVTHHSLYYKYYQLIKGKGIGLLYLDECNKLIEHTPALECREHLDHTVLFKLLRKDEYSSIVQNVFGSLPDVPNTKYFRYCLELVNTIPVQEFQSLVIAKLKGRNANALKHITSKLTPTELRYLCYTLNLEAKEYQTLYSFLSMSFNS